MVQLLEFFLRLDCIGVHTLAYRPGSLNDWPESEREGKKKPPGQKDLTALAIGRILAVSDSAFTSWISELAKLPVSPDEEIPFSGGSSNGGFWSRKVENALSFNGG